MEKNTSSLMIIVVLIVGLGIGYVFGTSSSQNNHQMPDSSMMHNDHANSAMDEAMHDMTTALEGKTGADFDKEFLAQMIVHHQGAVEMAEMVLKQSNQAELRDFANDIISVQAQEINIMQNWLDNGFVRTSAPLGNNQNGNGGNGMVACTMEAKICPDGSAVGRQGPNCEFAKCPGE